MLDDDDAGWFWLLTLFSNGWASLVLLLIAVAVFVTVAMNHGNCAKRTCPTGQTPQLINHACLCATEAK